MAGARDDKHMIECKKISKVYRTGDTETHALKNVSFEIPDGAFVAIMGPSGSGKSTLMHILGCLDTPTSGHYLLDGRDVSALSDDELARVRMEKIGFVFQAFNLLPRTSVIRNVSLPLVYAGVSKESREDAARAALSGAGFPEAFWRHRSNQLSGGMMQRVAIARALINRPDVILADEPAANLDPINTWEIIKLLQKINSLGTTVLLSTHDKEIINNLDKRVIVLDKGAVMSDKANGKYLI